MSPPVDHVDVRTGSGTYPVHVGEGLLGSAGDAVGSTGPALVVTDSNVGPLYLDALAARHELVGVVREAKRDPVGASAGDEPAVMREHLAERNEAERRYFGERGVSFERFQRRCLRGGVLAKVANVPFALAMPLFTLAFFRDLGSRPPGLRAGKAAGLGGGVLLALRGASSIGPFGPCSPTGSCTKPRWRASP